MEIPLKLRRAGPISHSVDTFLDNAQRIFDVARADSSAEGSDFALLVRRDGGLHVIMESPVSLDAALASGASTAYRVTRSGDGVRVTGRTWNRDFSLEERAPRKTLASFLRDQPLYSIVSPLLTSAAS